MTKFFSTFSAYLFLLVILIFEGLGLPFGRNFSLSFILLSSFILFGIDILNKKAIQIPVNITILFILFSFFTAISTISAVNMQVSLQHQLYYLSVFLFFIYTYNHQKELKPLFKYFVLICTTITFIYTFFINLLLPDTWSFLIPQNGFQFVFENSNKFSHHPIGTFILIPLVFLSIRLWEKVDVKYGIGFLFSFLLLIFSMVRSSYVAFITVVLIYISSLGRLQRINKSRKIVPLALIGITILSFLIVTNVSSKIPLLGNVNQLVISHIPFLENKSLLNSRDKFIGDAIESISHKPLLGVGSFNYYYASMRYTESERLITGTSHNLFLDILVENGLIAGILFIILIVIIINTEFRVLKGKSIDDKILYSIALALLVLFQFSHYHKMYFLFIFFFFLVGLIYEEKKNVIDKFHISLGTSAMLLIFIIISFISNILYRYNMPHVASAIYPLSVEAKRGSITAYFEEQSYQKAELQAVQLYSSYSEEPFVLAFIGDFYKNISVPEEAIKYYLLTLKYTPNDIVYLTFIYDEYEKVSGKMSAKFFVQGYINQSGVLKRNPPSGSTYWFYEWCSKKAIECSVK